MLPPFQLYKADSWTAALQTKAMSEWIIPCLYHFKVSHMDGSTIISPIVPNSRQTPNISALCDTSETQWCGIRLQTAASKPHGGIALYRDILANVLDISASKGTENSETDKETEQKFNKGEKSRQWGRKNEPIRMCKKALNYLSISAPFAEARDNQDFLLFVRAVGKSKP